MDIEREVSKPDGVITTVDTGDTEEVESPQAVPEAAKNADNFEEEDFVQEVAEEDEENLLTEDAYALLFIAPMCSRTALFAWFSILLQGGMLLVTFLDLFEVAREPSE